MNIKLGMHLVSRNCSCPWHVCMYVSVCPPSRLLITSGIIWITYDWLNKCYSFCVAAIVDSTIMHGHTIKVRQRISVNEFQWYKTYNEWNIIPDPYTVCSAKQVVNVYRLFSWVWFCYQRDQLEKVMVWIVTAPLQDFFITFKPLNTMN